MVRILFSAIIALLFVAQPAIAANTVDDIFTVSSLTSSQATLTGKVLSLKSGDSLYFMRSPFKFKISAVGTNSVVIELPIGSDVVAGNTMVRSPTPTIQKALDTESKLKSALGE